MVFEFECDFTVVLTLCADCHKTPAKPVQPKQDTPAQLAGMLDRHLWRTRGQRDGHRESIYGRRY